MSSLKPLIACLLLLVPGCAHLPLRAHADFRRSEYFATNPELTPTIANAIVTGHVVQGMNREQVRVVLGDAVRKSEFKTPKAVIEVWLYPSVRVHQDPVHSHGASSFRLVFMDGILRIIEPI